MANTLVVYYSRSGTTRRLAKMLARELDADLEEIVDDGDRRGVLGYLRSGLEAALRRVPAIHPLEHDPSTYDLVVVGTPIWNWSLSAPVRAFLDEHGKQLDRFAFFCTCGSSGSGRVFRQMRELCGKNPVAQLVVTAGTSSANDYGGRVRRFVDAAMQWISRPPQAPRAQPS